MGAEEKETNLLPFQESDSYPDLACARRAANTMDVGFDVEGALIRDDVLDVFHVHTSSHGVSAYQAIP